MAFSNELSLAEEERLAILAEECGEVVQMVGKILRHGYESYHPRDEAKTTNRRKLENEISNIRCIVRMMVDEKDIDEHTMIVDEGLKRITGAKYLHHQ